MMKRFRAAITVAVAALAVVCGGRTSDKGKGSSGPAPQLSARVSDARARNDSLLDVICARQDAIYASPGAPDLVASLLSCAFDTVSGSFYTVGKATFNPDYPAGAREEARERAARYVGERWALYLKAWHTGSAIPFGASMSGRITGSTQLYGKQRGDTLYRLLMVPADDIVLDASK